MFTSSISLLSCLLGVFELVEYLIVHADLPFWGGVGTFKSESPKLV